MYLRKSLLGGEEPRISIPIGNASTYTDDEYNIDPGVLRDDIQTRNIVSLIS